MLPGSRLEDNKIPSEKQISRIKREFFAEIDRLFGDETPARVNETEKRPSEANSKTRKEILLPNRVSPLFEDDKLANVESTSHMIRQGTVREYLTYLSNRTHILEHLSKKKSTRTNYGKQWNHHHCRRLGCVIYKLSHHPLAIVSATWTSISSVIWTRSAVRQHTM